MDKIKLHFKFLFIFYEFILLYFYFTKYIMDSSIANLRKLQENQTFSEIIVIADINDPYINPSFYPKPYI